MAKDTDKKTKKVGTKKAKKAAEIPQPEEKTEEQGVILNSKLQKKKENREAKAARKAKNKTEEKQKRPSNLIIFLLIIVPLLAIFGYVGGYEYFEKEESIESYIDSTGYAEYFESMSLTDTATMSLKAEKNDLTIVITDEGDDKSAVEEEYAGDKGTIYIKYIAAYYLNMMKPSTRAIFASADVTVKYGDEEINHVTVRYSQYNKIEKEYQEAFADEIADAEESEESSADTSSTETEE